MVRSLVFAFPVVPRNYTWFDAANNRGLPEGGSRKDNTRVRPSRDGKAYTRSRSSASAAFIRSTRGTASHFALRAFCEVPNPSRRQAWALCTHDP